MKPWSDLPNAAHIDRVLTHLREHPECWGAARDAARGAAWGAAWGVARSAAWDAARGAAWGAARDAAWDAAGGAAWDAARDAAWSTAWGAARDAAWDAAGNAIAALVAWDDCADLLCLPPDVLRARINLVGNDHAAALLLPAAIAMQGSNTE